MKAYDVVAYPYGDYNFDGGYRSIKKYMEGKQSWDIDVIYSHNDDMALGAVKALKEMGITPGVDVLIVSIDGIAPALKALKKGELNCVLSVAPCLDPS